MISAQHTRSRGSASMFVITAVILLGVAASVVIAALSILATQTRVAQAADLAALAGAERVPLDGESGACAQSARIAVANQTKLDTCEVRALDVQISVSAAPPVPGGARLTVSARARAGPPDDP